MTEFMTLDLPRFSHLLEYLAAGMTPQEIVDEFPDLTPEDIRACLAYAGGRELG